MININLFKSGSEIIKNRNKSRNFSSLLRTLEDLKKISIQRTMMNQLLEKITFPFNIIDIGGGQKANYRSYFNKNKYTSVNIDKQIQPDILLKVGDKIPLKDSSFDGCLLFNILEHVFNWDDLLLECSRVVKKNGIIYIIIPFSYPIHGCPDDFIRATDSYFKKKLLELNFIDINIFSISFGPFSTSQLFILKQRYLSVFISQISVIIDWILKILFPNKIANFTKNSPLFYYVECKVNK